MKRKKLPDVLAIAGGRGFVGSALARHLLEAGASVVSVDCGLFAPALDYFQIRDHPYFTDILGDVTDASILERVKDNRGLSAIINCAGPARPSYCRRFPADAFSNIVNTTHSLIELAISLDAHYVHASSSEIYGNVDIIPIKEDVHFFVDHLNPFRAYAAAKLAAESLICTNVTQRRLRASILRLFNVYGPHFGDDDDRVVPTYIKALENDKSLPVFGDGSQIRAYCYIDDVVRAFIEFIKIDWKHSVCINIGNPEPIAVLGLAKLISEIWSKEISISFEAPRSGDVASRAPDISAAKEMLNWTPTLDLRAGLQKCLTARKAIRPNK